MKKFKHEDVLLANKQYYNEVADDYLENEFYAYTPIIKQDVKSIMTRSASLCPNNGLFLDIGCGSGFLSKIVSDENLFKACLGVDISEKQVEMYNEYFKAKKNFEASIGDATNLVNIESNTVDMVAGYSVLHHFFDYHTVLAECLRVLKPGGVAYFDFEPNFEFRKKMIFFVNLRRKFLPKSPSHVDGLEDVAEFHNNYSMGINFRSIVENFSDEMEVIETGGRYIETPIGKVMFWCKFMGDISKPLFYFVVRKR